MTYLEQLQADHATLTEILQTQRTYTHATRGMHITAGIYIHILEDALTTLNSLIQHLASSPPKSPHARGGYLGEMPDRAEGVE